MKKLICLIGVVVGLAANSEAAGLRRLPMLTVPEGASVEFKAESAVSLRSSNTAIASVTPPDGGRANVTGIRIGSVEVTCVDVRGPFAVLPVTVVPTYWETLQRFFEDDPEVVVSVGGEKVIVSGRTSSPETLRRVEQSKAFDPTRIISQVTYSTPSIAMLLGSYLVHVGYSNVTASAIGNEICLAGRLYDRPTIKAVETRAKEFLKDFPGIGLNIDALQVFRQKIVIELEMLEYDVNQARNLGIEWPTAIKATGSFGYGWDLSRDASDSGTSGRSSSDSGSNGENSSYERTLSKEPKTTTDKDGNKTVVTPIEMLEMLTETESSGWSKNSSGSTSAESSSKATTTHKNNWSMNSSVKVNDVSMTVNLLKQNGVSKTLYKTSLATQSGEEAQFQNGGTIHRNTSGTFSSGDLKTIEYGFIIKARPQIVDSRTVTLELDLDNKTPKDYIPGSSQIQDIDVARYQTKSKYTVSPGETIILSGFNQIDEKQKRSGVPWLSQIPWIGEWLFGNTYTVNDTSEMLLVVKIDWAIDDGSATAIRQRDELKARKAEVEMP